MDEKKLIKYRCLVFEFIKRCGVLQKAQRIYFV